jgi:hypothetical protein
MFSFNINAVPDGTSMKIVFNGENTNVTVDIYDLFFLSGQLSSFSARLTAAGVQGGLTLTDVSMYPDVYGDGQRKNNIQTSMRIAPAYDISGGQIYIPTFICNQKTAAMSDAPAVSEACTNLGKYSAAFSMYAPAAGETDIAVMQAGTQCFYDYTYVKDGVWIEGEAAYSLINVFWEVRDELNGYDAGYELVRTQLGNGLKETVEISDRFINRKRDRYLKQSATYVYSISGYAYSMADPAGADPKAPNLLSAAVPKLQVRYEDFEAYTKKSRPMRVVSVFLGIAGAVGGVTALFIFWPDIKKLKKRRDKSKAGDRNAQ